MNTARRKTDRIAARNSAALTTFRDPVRTALLAAVAGLFGLPAAALADKNWNTTIEIGNWNVPANWQENAVPTSNDNVNILFNEAAFHSVTLDTTFTSALALNLDNKTGVTNANLVVGAGISLTVGAANLGIDGTGRINQSGGTITVNGIEYLGVNGNGSVLQTGGVHNVGSDTDNGELHIGQGQGSIGTYTLNDGMLLVQFEQVGISGQGLFIQTGGINQTTYGPHGGGTFTVGDSSLGSGGYSLQGGTLTTGGEHWGYLGPAIMNMSGGLHNTGGLNLGVDGTATYNQSGGVTEIDGGMTIGGYNTPGTFNLSGTGVLNIVGSLYIGGNYSASSNTGILNLNGGTLTVSPNVANSVIRVWASSGTALLINPAAKVDLTTGALVYQTTAATKSVQLSALAASINLGSNGGLWTGNGITSTTAAADHTRYGVGLFDNATLGQGGLHGAAMDANDLFAIIAHLGDANYSGIIDIQDQSIVTNHWQSAQLAWSSGDLNLDGFVDLQDLTLVTNSWQQSSSYSLEPSELSAGAGIVASVPEPASLLLLIPSLLLGTRRRR